jgi:PAS domain S-box-containing protein
MGWHPQPFIFALLVTSLVSVGLAGVGYRNRDANGALAFIVMMLAVALWAYGDAVQLLAGDWQSYVWWMRITFATGVVSATAGFVFVVAYTGKDHLVTRETLALLAVEPLVVITLVWTNGDHELMWRYVGELQTSPVTWVATENGLAYSLHLAYTYGLLAVLLALLVRFYLRSRGTYRWQTLLMLLGALIPTATNVFWVVVQSTYPETIDPTPVTFVLTGMLFTAGLRSFDLLELAPVGRHTVVEELPDAVLTVNGDERVVDANPVVSELLAEGGEPLVGEDAAAVVPAYEGMLAGGEADDVALTVDGERRYFDVRQSSLTDAAGEVVGRVVLLRDVTERRRVEKHYQLLIENSTDLISVVDEDATVKYVSPSVRSILGYDPENIVGTSAFGYVHPEDREEVVERFEELADQPGEELRVDYRIRTRDGTFREVESRGQNLLDDPVVEGIVVNLRDVTERRERERRLQQRNDQLEEFASVISHDLRGPLSVAHGYARLLEEDHGEDDRVGKVVAAHERMEELIEDLLTLAREGRAVSEPAPVVFEDACRQAWAIVDTRGAELVVDSDRELMADDTRLRQLLENLFSNAVEHSAVDPDEETAEDQEVAPTADGAGEPSVTVTVDTVEGGFSVADDGPGIPEEDREQVLEAGQTSDDRGIGLGLTIVKRIADAHGWTVGVGESDDGGAKFTFRDVEWADD